MSPYESQDERLNNDYHHYCFALGHLINSFNRLEGLAAVLAVMSSKLAHGFSVLDVNENDRMPLADRPSLRKSFQELRAMLVKSGVSIDSLKTFDDVHRQIIKIKQLRDDLTHSPVTSTIGIVDRQWKYLKWTKTDTQIVPRFHVFDSRNLIDAANDLSHAGDLLSGIPQAPSFTGQKFMLHKPTWTFSEADVQPASEKVFVRLADAEMRIWLAEVAQVDGSE